MIINFKTLPKELLKKIPLSIRSKVDSIDLNELPIEVAYEVKSYSEPVRQDLSIKEKVYDVVPEITIYNDFKFLTTKKQAIIEYVKNYLLIRKGTYPFDPGFGNNFYKYIQLLDTHVSELMVSNEFNELREIISGIFETSVEFTNFSSEKVSNGIGTEYVLNIDIIVENESVTLNANL